MVSVPSVYFVLGTPGSGRRAVVIDLIENGLSADDRAVVVIPEGEAPAPADSAFTKRKATSVLRWRWQAPGFPDLQIPEGARAFILADPMVSAVDQLEALKPWLAERGAELGRVITIVDCQLAEREPALRGWFEACIHFSDAVFLTNRDGVANKWLSDFINHFKKLAFPCHFIRLKRGGIENPALVLDPTPRRVSQYFDEFEDLSGIEIETEDEDEEDEENEDLPVEDPYFARMRGGRRVKEVPDLRNYLAKP